MPILTRSAAVAGAETTNASAQSSKQAIAAGLHRSLITEKRSGIDWIHRRMTVCRSLFILVASREAKQLCRQAAADRGDLLRLEAGIGDDPVWLLLADRKRHV